MLLNRIRNFVRDNRGQALVEMALTLPILLMLILGIMEFGRVMHSYLVVTNAAREGARAGIVGASTMGIEAAVESVSQSLASDLLTVAVEPTDGNRQTGQPITVTVSYPVTIYAPVIASIISNPYTVTGTAVMRME